MNIPLALGQLWLAVAFMAALSYIWRGNPFFTLIVQIIVGAAAGNYVVVTIRTLRSTVYASTLAGNLIILIPFAIALLMFATFSGKYRWLARYPTAVMTGTGLGLALRNIIQTQVIAQILELMRPITTADMATNLSNLIFIVIAFLSTYYFIFSFELKGRWVQVNRVARILMMMAFGGQAGSQFFGNTTVGVGTFLLWYEYIGGFIQNLLP